MRLLEAMALALISAPACAQLPSSVSLEELLHIVETSPRIVASEREADAARVERIGGLVSGRLASGMASRYDLARAEAELVLAGLGVQRAEAEVAEHAAALAALVEAPGWRPRAAGSLRALQGLADRPADAASALARNPTLRVARDEASVADAR